MKILMCRPLFFGIEYEINPWMKIEKKVNHHLALEQWERLYQTILKCGATVELIDPVPGCPDMVFTANAGLLYNDWVFLSYFKHKERQTEQPYFEHWFKKAGFVIQDPSINKTTLQPFSFEGAGDALSMKETLFAGYGFRTERIFYEETDDLSSSPLVYCELTDPYFYHLDTCFCPINSTTAIWYPNAFTKQAQKNMQEKANLIAVEENEARRFACNAVVLGKDIIIPSDCPTISAELEKEGLTVHECDMSEFLKSGGACKCLTLRLDD